MTPEQRQLLIDAFISFRWSQLDYTALDAAYQAATPAEKQKLMESLKGNGDGARIIIKQKFNEKLTVSVTAQVDQFITDQPQLMSLFAQILQIRA